MTSEINEENAPRLPEGSTGLVWYPTRGAYRTTTALAQTPQRGTMRRLPNRTCHLERRTYQHWTQWYGHAMKRATAREPSPGTSTSTVVK
jgi:hypothetical protein